MHTSQGINLAAQSPDTVAAWGQLHNATGLGSTIRASMFQIWGDACKSFMWSRAEQRKLICVCILSRILAPHSCLFRLLEIIAPHPCLCRLLEIIAPHPCRCRVLANRALANGLVMRGSQGEFCVAWYSAQLAPHAAKYVHFAVHNASDQAVHNLFYNPTCRAIKASHEQATLWAQACHLNPGRQR